jgi:ribose 5-phosphate isomerase B
MSKRLAVGSDHAGFQLKQALLTHLRARGHQVTDLGVSAPERCDYPDYAARVAAAVAAGDADLGVLCCGTGIGMAMAANKVDGIRAAVVSDTFSAHATREHNDANVLCVGERVVGVGLAIDIVDAFVDTEFEGGRHAARVAKIMNLQS